MNSEYERSIAEGLTLMRDWIADHEINPKTLPESPWNLPKDCPLWHLGLSLAQASGILATVRAGR